MKVMGVDLGIRKIAYSIWDKGVLVGAYAYETNELVRYDELEVASNWLGEAVTYEKPDLVVIEETLVGNNTKYSIKLAQMMGAVLANLSVVKQYAIADGWDFDILTANVKQWKKDVIGNGNASKELIREHVISWDSAYSVLCGRDQDRFDAACIGYYGLILHARAVALTGQLPGGNGP